MENSSEWCRMAATHEHAVRERQPAPGPPAPGEPRVRLDVGGL